MKINTSIFQIKSFKFLFFGIFTTLLNLFIFFLLSKFIYNYFFLLLIYYIIAVSIKFSTYKVFVFNEKFFVQTKKKFIKYLILILIFYILNYFYLSICAENFDIEIVVFQIAFVLIGTPISYLIMKFKIFNAE